MPDIKPFWPNYIDGEWVEGGEGWLPVLDPATGQEIAKQALADAADIDRAVSAARTCFQTGVLAAMRPCDLGRMVRRMGDYLLDHIEEIAPILTLESGKSLWESRIEIQGAARFFEYYGGQAETMEGVSIPLGQNFLDFTVNEPYGVTAHVIPWNYPVEMTARSLAPALATGNTCVIKTPELDPLTNAYLVEAAEAVGFPKGAVNILCGHGKTAGAALVSHPDVDQIVFTGSVQTGRSIAVAAAHNLVPCVLELGGKSAAIVYPDADLDQFIDSVRWGIYFNAGQVCSAMSRIILHEDIHDDFVERIVDLAKGLDVGPGIGFPEFGMNMGPMISEPQRDRAEAICRQAESDGAVAVTGGRRLNRDGFFLQPTVFTNVTPDMNVARDEIFGPVTSVLKFRSDKDAMDIANGTDFGLVGGVFTEDLERAMDVARKIRGGQVFVNEWYAGGVETPFGGTGQSGYGREKGREAMRNYVTTKNIGIATRKGR
ncbi:aldehyde dehydrogenase family protein [Roseovarius sp. 2305UL8-3]|uniref:aldehyde dehydrogenase family protein n=1 Tax=Roseovarius conchicola TaxID=3121636 RepID=UPI003528DBD0